MVEVVEFRASLQSEGMLGEGWREGFERLVDIGRRCSDPGDLEVAFEEDRTLRGLQGELQRLYDKVMTEKLFERQRDSSKRRTASVDPS